MSKISPFTKNLKPSNLILDQSQFDLPETYIVVAHRFVEKWAVNNEGQSYDTHTKQLRFSIIPSTYLENWHKLQDQTVFQSFDKFVENTNRIDVTFEDITDSSSNYTPINDNESIIKLIDPEFKLQYNRRTHKYDQIQINAKRYCVVEQKVDFNNIHAYEQLSLF